MEPMKLKIEESRMKPKSQLGESFLLRDMDSGMIVKKLEENIRLRETPIAGRIKEKLLE